ncbi:MAG: response regulator [Rhodoferax sp.]|nr:response regulator [Rhodoferax sp.]
MSLSEQPPRVLVVEDEAIVARDIALQLSELGYQAAGIAGNAEQALEMVATQAPDLVLMDIQLGGPSDGIAAAETIRRQYGLPVVFITAYSADEILARAKLTEPYGYILKPFTDRELRVTLTMALYKHQAEAKLQTSSRQLKALSRHVLEVQELERRRVAIELHDELGQSLTAIKINLQLSQRLKDQPLADLNQESIRIVEDALQQVRRLATTLRPSMLDDLGLAPALKWIAEQSAARGGFAVNFHHVRAQTRLAPDIETACFRIVQEALTNITRHAQARQVDISLRREADDMVLSVQDDGRGFDTDAMRLRAVQGGSLGVLGMQERANLIGGQLSIRSVSGSGSTVQLSCPWRTHLEPV